MTIDINKFMVLVDSKETSGWFIKTKKEVNKDLEDFAVSIYNVDADGVVDNLGIVRIIEKGTVIV